MSKVDCEDREMLIYYVKSRSEGKKYIENFIKTCILKEK